MHHSLCGSPLDLAQRGWEPHLEFPNMPARYTTRPDGTVGTIAHDITVNFNYDIAGNAVDAWAFVADADYEITKIYCIPTVAGNNGSAVTADVVKASGTTAVSSGTTVCSAADSLDLKGAANTLQTATLSTTDATRRLTAGDRLGINFTGTLTLAVGLIQINLKRIQSANAAY